MKEDLQKRKTYYNALPQDFAATTPLVLDTLGDRRMDDVGTFLIASSGQSVANTVVGEAYVEYSCRHETPTSNQNVIPFYTFNGIPAGGNTLTPAKPMGVFSSTQVAPYVPTQSSTEFAGLPITYVAVATNSRFAFGAPGWYHISIMGQGTVMSVGATVSAGGTGSLLTQAFTASTATIQTYDAYFYCNTQLMNSSASIPPGTYGTIDISFAATTVTQGLIRITQSPPVLLYSYGPANPRGRLGRKRLAEAWSAAEKMLGELSTSSVSLAGLESPFLCIEGAISAPGEAVSDCPKNTITPYPVPVPCPMKGPHVGPPSRIVHYSEASLGPGELARLTGVLHGDLLADVVLEMGDLESLDSLGGLSVPRKGEICHLSLGNRQYYLMRDLWGTLCYAEK